jgi:hypothetical protein
MGRTRATFSHGEEAIEMLFEKFEDTGRFEH